MDPFIIGGLLSGIGSLGSSIIGNTAGYSQSKKLMDYQYQLQQQAIDKANAYNHPAEQMKRLAQAQLSPNLVYGNGVDGNQASPANPSMANRQVKIDNPLQDLGQNLMARKQMELDQIRVRNEAFESRERQLNLRAKTLGQMLDNRFMSETLNTKIQHAAQRLANDVANEALTWSRTRNEDNKLAQIFAQTDYIKERTNLTREQALTEVVKRRSIEAGIMLTGAQIKQAASYIEFLDEGTKLRKQGRDIQKTAYDAQKIYQEWKAKHPTATLTFEMVKEILDIGKGVASMAAPFIP